MNKLEAFKKLEKYHYLINTPLSKSDGGFPITDIVVIPRDTEYWESFFNHYIASKRNEVALAGCGYKGDDFTILLLHYNGYNNFHVHSEINKFLQKNN
jgi:hypothetical protein